MTASSALRALEVLTPPAEKGRPAPRHPDANPDAAGTGVASESGGSGVASKAANPCVVASETCGTSVASETARPEWATGATSRGVDLAAANSGVSRETARPGATLEAAHEQALVTQAKEGCETAFRALVEAHQDAVYHFCYQWLSCPEEAREACQDTFVRAYRALPRYQPRGRFFTWLYKIALNRCRDARRSRRARARSQAVPLEDAAPHDLACRRATPDEQAAHQEDLKKLRQGLEALPFRHRAVLQLTCLEGLNHEATAAVLGCSPRAVEGRLYRARRHLLQWWERQA